MTSLKWFALASLAFTFAGCMHLKGVVVDEATGRPIKTAVITVGRPGGIAVFLSQPVDQKGAFDFNISTADTTNVYVYDSIAAPELTTVHLESSQLGEKMKLRLRPPPRQENPMMVPRE